MTRADALFIRAEMLAGARRMAIIAGMEELPWGCRYQAAVTGDHCLDIAKECDAYIKEHLQRS
jgi:hypothetical protein